MRRISNLLRQRSRAAAALMISCLLVLAYVITSTKIVTITDGSKRVVVRSLHNGAEDIIDQAGIALGKFDTYSARLSGTIGSITIERAFPVTLKYDGTEKTVMTTGESVKDFLVQQNIALGTYDIVNHDMYEPLSENMNVVVSRVKFELVNKDTAIPFGTTTVSSKNVPRGRYRVTSPGEKGVAHALMQNMYVDGRLANSKILEQKVLKKPTNEVVEYGTGGEQETSRGENFRYSYYFDAKATAYTSGEAGVNKTTATGKQVQVGYVAVDPKVIPLGTRLYIEYPNGKWAYGFAVAEDTGGAIKGKRVDLYFNTLKEAYAFGVRTVRVFVLE